MLEPQQDHEDVPQIGVGPWPGDPEDFPDDPRLAPELLRLGDRRNVVDRYRYWRHDAIVADLDRSRHPLHIAIENWEHDFNIGSIVRTANAFNVAAFHIVGRRRWNRRGAMVTDRYQHEIHHPDAHHLARWAADHNLALLGVDNVPGSVPLENYPMPRECVLIFGAEGPGLTPALQERCDSVLHITQYGSTRSMNAGAAAAIAMYAWAIRWAQASGVPS